MLRKYLCHAWSNNNVPFLHKRFDENIPCRQSFLTAHHAAPQMRLQPDYEDAKTLELNGVSVLAYSSKGG